MTTHDAARIVANPDSETSMDGAAYGRHDMRDVVAAIRHGWTVVWDEILKGLEKAPSLH